MFQKIVSAFNIKREETGDPPEARTCPVTINVMCRALPRVAGFSEIRDLG
jgi:hypothetical protein